MSAQLAKDAEMDWLAWQRKLKPYLRQDMRRVWGQLLSTVGGYVFVVAGMVWMVLQGIPYVYVLATSVVPAGLLMRMFIFFHDACHHSYFSSSRANAIIGHVLGTLVFTPYHDWRTQHLHHHTTVADLDSRGAGDVWTMTVEEYLASPAMVRVIYRVFRHPLFLFTVAPVFNFILLQRIPSRGAGRIQKVSVLITDLAILVIAALASLTIGFGTYVAVQLPIIAIGTAAGTWMFYIQHQFDGVYWARHGHWDPVKAGLIGSSYYQLPRLLQWVSGNIGYHHVHHLSPRMPNYNLQRAYEEVPELQVVRPLTWRKSLACVRLNLWDERQGKLVSFGALRQATRGV